MPSVSISSFAIVRQGADKIVVEVAPNINRAKDISAHIKSCGSKKLSASEQASTSFILKGDDEADATTILENKAVLASEQPIASPTMPTGSWVRLDVSYTALNLGRVVAAIKEIKEPLVVIDSRLSSVLSNIEEDARRVGKAHCR